MMALAGTILIALTAGLVLNLSMRRYEMTAFRVERMKAFNASEAGTQYAWGRLTVNDTEQFNNIPGDPPAWNQPGLTFQQRIQQRLQDPSASGPLIISSDENQKPSPHHLEPGLQLAGRDITVQIFYNNDNDPATNDFRVEASTEYGK